MKHLRKLLLGLGLLLIAVALLAWFLPARWALPWIAPSLHGVRLSRVQGQLWDGRADAVLDARGHSLGSVRWRLSRRALLGDVRLHVDFDGPRLGFSGAMRSLGDGKVAWRDATIRADIAALVPPLPPPWGAPRGDLHVAVKHALVQGGWPLELEADMQWRHAALHRAAGDIALGEVRMQLSAKGGVIRAQLGDAGTGPLAIDGQLQLSPLGWRIDATLRPRTADPVLRGWLARIGPVDATGATRVERGGGLANTLPAPAGSARR